MNPHFLDCSVPNITYLQGQKYINQTVNLGLCTSIGKMQVKWYPDNQGKPGIFFVGCDVQWAFDSEKDRDAEYSKIVSIKG